MTEIILFHVLAATAGAAFGLLAIWTGLGRLHWSMRFIPVAAVIVSLFPVPAFDLALVFVAQALVVVVPLLLVRRFTLPADGTATEAPPTSHPWRRFSVADLFRATLLIAAVFGVVAYLPGEVRESWWKYALVGGGFGVATLAGAWSALAHHPWWIRLGVVCLVAPLAGVPTALDKTIYADFRDQGWPWCAVTAIVGLLVVLWLCLAKSAGSTALRRTEFGPTGQRTPTQSVAVACGRRASVGLVSLAILLLPGVAYYDMLHSAPIPMGPPLEPNAYDDLLRIATAWKAVAATGNVATAVEPADQHALFDELHTTLLRPVSVPLRYDSAELNWDQSAVLRQLTQALWAEGDRCTAAGNTIDALRNYLDVLELALASSRGGLLIHRLVGTAFEAMAIEGLRNLRGMLSSDQRQALIAALQVHETRWEPGAAVSERELAWQHRFEGWPSRISFVNLPAKSRIPEAIENRRLASLRLLICELALAQYTAEHGRRPKDLAGLVPQYLPEVPEDPFSGRPLVYRTDSTGYTLYSVGQNGTDDGGQRSASFRFDADQFLDPVPPPPASDATDED